MKLYKHAKLQEAFDLFVAQQNALLPDEETVATVTLSENFKERMRKMLNRQKCGFFVLFGTAGRRVASILITLLVAAAVTTVSVEALREPVVQFFTQVFERFTQVFFVDDTSDTPQVEMEKRTPAYIPEGYVLEKEEDFGHIYRIIYTNPSTNDSIRYNQRLEEKSEIKANTEGAQHTEVTINEFQGVSYNNNGIITVLFSDGIYTYTLSSKLAMDELVKIAESIK